MKHDPIALSSASTGARPVKRVALLAFRLARRASEGAAQVPGFLTQATRDVRDAWRESARPNV